MELELLQTISVTQLTVRAQMELRNQVFYTANISYNIAHIYIATKCTYLGSSAVTHEL